MGLKLLAGFLAAVLVAGAGTFYAYHNDLFGSDSHCSGSCPLSSGLPVSEGESCCSASASACPHDTGCPVDAMAACTGGSVAGVQTTKTKVTCCSE